MLAKAWFSAMTRSPQVNEDPALEAMMAKMTIVGGGHASGTRYNPPRAHAVNHLCPSILSVCVHHPYMYTLMNTSVPFVLVTASVVHRLIRLHPDVSGITDTPLDSRSPYFAREDEGQHLQKVYPPS
jgi:hypothetical protein